MAVPITGKDAALYVYFNVPNEWLLLGLLREWSLDVHAPLYPAAIKGDLWRRQVPSALGEGTLRAQHWYASGFSNASLILASTGAASYSRFDWILVSLDEGVTNFSANPFSKAQGTGYFEQGRLIANHREGYQDEFALRLDTTPLIT